MISMRGLVLTTLMNLLMTTALIAQDIPSEEVKKDALMRAYQANGNSMVGWGSYDGSVRTIKTEKILLPPAQNIADTELEVVPLPQPQPDTCKRHGMHKITSGKSWRCQK